VWQIEHDPMKPAMLLQHRGQQRPMSAADVGQRPRFAKVVNLDPGRIDPNQLRFAPTNWTFDLLRLEPADDCSASYYNQ
jgi:hypothetical protein